MGIETDNELRQHRHNHQYLRVPLEPEVDLDFELRSPQHGSSV